jgi:hypothetical protein
LSVSRDLLWICKLSVTQCDIKSITTLPIKTIVSVLKISTYAITNITARLIRLSAILVLMSRPSSFIAQLLYIITTIVKLELVSFKTFNAPATKSRGGGGILIYPCPSGYRYMVCPAISSYSFGATALIFCRMFIHIMEVCMSTGFWFSSNILKMIGGWT